MKSNFSISTNIERDADKDLNYILTPNSKDIFDRIISNYKTGNHSFNIIGSYGTGKSSFLWAFENNLKNKKPIFEPLNGQFKGLQEFDFLKLIGESTSFKNSFAEKIGLEKYNKDAEIFEKLDVYYAKAKKQKKVLIILVDEFGKFLEYAAKNNPEEELYFIQQLAEYANDEDKSIIFITTLHQNFSTYAKGLSLEQKSEWEKVRGRVTDLAFDEPIEQLLFFASEILSERNIKINSKKKFQELFKLIKGTKLLSNSSELNEVLAEKLIPLDYLSAFVLTNALQRYGQNERSLFTFLASNDKYGIENFDGKYYNVSNVFDYLTRNLSTEIANPGNPHKGQWKSTFIALEKAEALLEDEFLDFSQIIKTIALTNIFGKSGGCLDSKTLTKYLELTSDINNPSLLIEQLIQKKIIKFFKHRNKLNFLDGTDADLDQELLNASKNVHLSTDVVSQLKEYFDFPYIPAKAYQYEYGTPRFFEIKLWDRIDSIKPEGEVDGYINLIITSDRIQSKIIEYSNESEEAQIFVLYKDFEGIKNELFEIQKYNYVIDKLHEDQVAVKILVEEKQKHVSNLNTLVVDNLFNGNEQVQWIYKDKLIGENNISNKGKLNKLLTKVCNNVYSESPKLKSELVNREILSTPIRTARKALIRSLLASVAEKNLGFPEDKFPPQKTIYLSLLKETGIHRMVDGELGLYEPTDKGVLPLWQVGEEFLGSAKAVKQKVSTFYDMLSESPYKVKSGLSEFWVFIFLIAKKEDFALFHSESGYVPYLSSDILDLVYKSPEKYQIKSYNVAGVNLNLFNKYQELTKLSDKKRTTKDTFLSIFRQFTLFYRALPEYSKNTNKLSNMAVGFRNTIAKAKDPETALFEEFPQAMGYDNLKLRDGDSDTIKGYVNQLDLSIGELRTAYDDLINRIESQFLKDLNIKKKDFKDYKPEIINRFKKIKVPLLTLKQKTFYNRLISKLDDRNSWVKSIADAILNKSIDKLRDEEEALLMENIKEMFNNLERLVDLHALKKERSEDVIIGVDFINSTGETVKDRIYITKEISIKAKPLEKELTSILKKFDSETAKAVLYQLLNKNIKKK